VAHQCQGITHEVSGFLERMDGLQDTSLGVAQEEEEELRLK